MYGTPPSPGRWQQWARPQGTIARRMAAAVEPYAERCFITPMAAVVWCRGREILATMTKGTELTRCYVNNGGDIALYLTPGESFSVGMVDRPDRPVVWQASYLLGGSYSWPGNQRWRGRSFSRHRRRGHRPGVDAPAADAAATIVANAVDPPDHPGDCSRTGV